MYNEEMKGLFLWAATFLFIIGICLLVFFGVDYLVETLRCQSYLNSDPLNVYKVIGYNCNIFVDGYWINTSDIYKLLGK